MVFPGGASQVAIVVKNPPANAGRRKRLGSHLWVGKTPWRKEWHPTPVFLPGEPHGQRSLAGYSASGRAESDTTEVAARTRAGRLVAAFGIFSAATRAARKLSVSA